MGIILGFSVAAAADVVGDPQTRGFTRPAFLLAAAVESGLSITGMASWAGDALEVAGALA